MALGAPTYLSTPGTLGNNLGLGYLASLIATTPVLGGFGVGPFSSAPFGQ